MKHKYKKAFTLTELLIAMALFSLIAASVTLFITSMNRYSQRNNAIIERLNVQEELREETDKWFAFFDRTGVSVEINVGTSAETSKNTLVRAYVNGSEGAVGWEYSIVMDTTEGGERIIKFTYPENPEEFDSDPTKTRTVEVKASQISTIWLTKQDPTQSPDAAKPQATGDEKEFTFPIITRVNSAKYLCKVIFY